MTVSGRPTAISGSARRALGTYIPGTSKNGGLGANLHADLRKVALRGTSKNGQNEAGRGCKLLALMQGSCHASVTFQKWRQQALKQLEIT